MATYTTSQTLSPIEGGTRTQSNYLVQSLETETGETVNRSENTGTGNTGRMTTLLMGSRSPQATGYPGISLMGSLISVDDSDPTRTYDMLDEYGVGIRQMTLTEEDLIIEERITGTRIKPIRSGVGSFGIQYQQTIIQTGDKRIRRWPRDWHGDNMKD